MNKYKCENHKLDLVCQGCVKVFIARHDKMLEFIRGLSGGLEVGLTDEEERLILSARTLLKEIGELNDFI